MKESRCQLIYHGRVKKTGKTKELWKMMNAKISKVMLPVNIVNTILIRNKVMKMLKILSRRLKKIVHTALYTISLVKTKKLTGWLILHDLMYEHQGGISSVIFLRSKILQKMQILWQLAGDYI
ncbi:hypothetical protein JTB14_009239 [Gonioctena quinquepunctata]|nr:hypothetical protein JTB14_009239 [Gonioctena quinquepunctata]